MTNHDTIKALRDALEISQKALECLGIGKHTREFAMRNAAEVLALTSDASEDAPAGENILARTAKLEDFHQSDPHDYAQFLAYVLWRDHYQEASPDFTIQAHKWGVMSQIDNMLTGLTRKVAANAARPAPVGAVQPVDAKRYRYLRDALPSHAWLWVAMGIPGQGCSWWHGEELDARIDLEIAQKVELCR